MLLLNIIVFLSSFLLFQLELIIAKFYLPFYGGTYLVWGACVVFFQATLVLGYYYAFRINLNRSLFQVRTIHLVLMALPFLFFPGRALVIPQIHPDIPFVIDVFFELIKSIGCVFFVLSTMTVVMQNMMVRARWFNHAQPYQLFAFSNLGSFLALLSYPFLFEYFFDLQTQFIIWRIGYLFLFILCLYFFLTTKFASDLDKDLSMPYVLHGKVKALWFILAMAGVVLFLSITEIVTQKIAPLPLFWVMPLAIYILSFVLTFKNPPIYSSWIKNHIHLLIGFSIFLYFMTLQRMLPVFLELFLCYVVLFCLCLFCQGELHQLRPHDKKALSVFYVTIALGGFVGGILVSWIMPLVSNVLDEYFIGLFLVALFILFSKNNFKIGLIPFLGTVIFIAVLFFWPIYFFNYDFWGILGLIGVFYAVLKILQKYPFLLCINLILIQIILPFAEAKWEDQNFIHMSRNYYGIYRITKEDNIRYLIHSGITHGAQALDYKKSLRPLTYYALTTPVGQVIHFSGKTFRRVGAIGLGVGTLAAYSLPGDIYDFYELDPHVYDLANNFFSYIKNAQGKLNFILGDARLMLRKAKPKSYDLLVVDAFSGDSIPVHLLSLEAFQLFHSLLKDDGVVLFHITNRYLNLKGVVAKNAKSLGAYVVRGMNPQDDRHCVYQSDWVVVSWDQSNLEKFVKLKSVHWESINKSAWPQRGWRDGYSHLLSIFNWGNFYDQFKNFKIFSSPIVGKKIEHWWKKK